MVACARIQEDRVVVQVCPGDEVIVEEPANKRSD